MARGSHDQADLEIFCLDGTRAPDKWELHELQRACRRNLSVLTKLDPRRESTPLPILRTGSAGMRVQDAGHSVRILWAEGPAPRAVELLKIDSASGYGLDRLRQRLGDLLSTLDDDAGVVASTATRCRESVRWAREAVSRALALATGGQGDELIATEVRAALDELGQVVGAVYDDDILDRVFRRFCIGK
jgi:tRNA U34 5-carboxymethylaminomethyl modifying GTPase MnmE/TrmE